jgi:hypothetical protein
MRTLSSLMRTEINFPVGHPSSNRSGQARLTSEFFGNELPEKKLQLVDMSILSIQFSPRPGYHMTRHKVCTAPASNITQPAMGIHLRHSRTCKAHYDHINHGRRVPHRCSGIIVVMISTTAYMVMLKLFYAQWATFCRSKTGGLIYDRVF